MFVVPSGVRVATQPAGELWTLGARLASVARSTGAHRVTPVVSDSGTSLAVAKADGSGVSGGKTAERPNALDGIARDEITAAAPALIRNPDTAAAPAPITIPDPATSRRPELKRPGGIGLTGEPRGRRCAGIGSLQRHEMG